MLRKKPSVELVVRSIMNRRQGIPVLIRGNSRTHLERIPLRAKEKTFDEEFIQRLIFEHPACLPIGEIEPGLSPFSSVCREMPTRHGPIDNLLMNADGDIAIVEAKLWRNSEARRQVIAQALDYAACIFEMGYAEFEASALQGGFGARPVPPSLFSLFDSPDGLEESQFIDAVSGNLSRGRIIILVAGDGIRSETERLASALHSHAGFHFTFALVELAVYSLPTSDDVLVVPSTLAQTRLIERGIVRMEQGAAQARVLPPRSPAPTRTSGSISSEQFFEAMAARDPRLPDRVRELIAGFEEFGAYPEFLRALNFKWDAPSRTFNLGVIQRDGQVWTDMAGSTPPIDTSRAYVQALASAIGGEIEKNKLGGNWYVTLRGRPPRAEQIMERFQAWVEVARAHVNRLRARNDAD